MIPEYVLINLSRLNVRKSRHTLGNRAKIVRSEMYVHLSSIQENVNADGSPALEAGMTLNLDSIEHNWNLSRG